MHKIGGADLQCVNNHYAKFEHVLSVERVYWLKEIAVEVEHELVVIDLTSEAPTAAPILTLPVRQRAGEINCI